VVKLTYLYLSNIKLSRRYGMVTDKGCLYLGRETIVKQTIKKLLRIKLYLKSVIKEITELGRGDGVFRAEIARGWLPG